MCTDELYASLRRAFLLPFSFRSFFFSSHFSLTITEPRATGSFGQSILQPGIFRHIDAPAPQSRLGYVATTDRALRFFLFIIVIYLPISEACNLFAYLRIYKILWDNV